MNRDIRKKHYVCHTKRQAWELIYSDETDQWHLYEYKLDDMKQSTRSIVSNETAKSFIQYYWENN